MTGVGFFDFDHGQTGVAPNAIDCIRCSRSAASAVSCADTAQWSAVADQNTFAAALAALEVFGDEERPLPPRQPMPNHSTENRAVPARHE